MFDPDKQKRLDELRKQFDTRLQIKQVEVKKKVTVYTILYDIGYRTDDENMVKKYLYAKVD